MARMLVHDMPGYVFVRDLASALGRAGHDVTFVTCSSFATPNEQSRTEAAGVRTVVIGLDDAFPKYHPLRRLRAELEYGKRLLAVIQDVRPEVVFSSNGPLLTQAVVERGTRRLGVSFVFWAQDLYGPAAVQLLAERLPAALARAAGAPFAALERHLLRRSEHVVVISRTLLDAAVGAGVDPAALSLLPNWTNPEQLRPGPRANPWSAEQGLDRVTTFLYSGTLGKKHPYEALLSLSRILGADCGDDAGNARRGPDTAVVVVSEGLGARWLAAHRTPSDRIRVLPYQPEHRLPETLAAADVLVLLLGPDASRYSLPSKFYTYACAGRPVLAVVPLDSEIARLIGETGCGLVVNVGDEEQLRWAADTLAGDPELRRRLGANGRAWAERTMDEEAIAASFGELADRLTAGRVVT